MKVFTEDKFRDVEIKNISRVLLSQWHYLITII